MIAFVAVTAAETVLTGQPGAEMVLNSAVDRLLGEDLHTAGPIDLVLFDCPPTLGLLAVSALVAAHEVVLPVGMGSMELDGAADLLRTVELVAQRLNAGLRIGAVIPTGFQSRQRLSQDVLASLTERFGDAVLSPIRASVRVREAPSAREPLTIYAPTEPVTEDFRAVTTAPYSAEEPVPMPVGPAVPRLPEMLIRCENHSQREHYDTYYRLKTGGRNYLVLGHPASIDARPGGRTLTSQLKPRRSSE